MKSPLLIFGTLLVLLLAGALATPFFVDWSTYRAEIEDYGRKVLGRDVRIAGDIDIQILPLPTLTLEDVRVANVENAASPVFISVKKLQAELLLAPLLRGQVRVHSVLLDRPEIDLERLPSGKGNWHLETASELAKAVPLTGFSLEGSKIIDGTIYVSDRRRAGKARFDQVNLNLSVGSAVGPYQARGTMSYKGDPIDVSVSTGKLRPDGTMRLGVRVKPQTGNRLLYSFDGKLLDDKADDIADGTLKIAPPPIADAVKSGPLSNLEKLPFLFSSKVTIGEEKLKFEKIELALDQSNAVTNAVTGSAEFSLGFEIGFDAKLSARRLDLDALARDLGTQLAQRLKSAVSLDTLDAVAGLLPNNVHGRVQVNAGQLITGAAVIETGKVDVSVTDTGVKITELSGLLPGRTRFELSGLYLPDPVTPQFNGAFRFNALDGRGFANWMRPGLYGEEAGRIGRLKFTGSLSATPEHGRIDGAKFEFDGGNGRGSLFWARSGSPFVEVELNSDALDLTSVMPRGRQSGLLDAPELVRQLNTGAAPLGLNMKVGQLTFAGRTLKDFAANVKFNGASVDVRRLAGTIGEKGTIDLAGSLAGKSGEMSGKVSSPQAIEMLQVLGVGELPDRLHALLDGDPLDVWLEYVSSPTNNRLSVEGLAGAGLIGLVLEADAPFSDWRKAKLDVDGVYETNRAHRLMSALGIQSAEAETTGKADAKISILAAGALPAGITGTVKAKFLSGSLDIAAELRDQGTGLSMSGKIEASTEDATAISKALGAGVVFEGEAAASGTFKGDKSGYRLTDVALALPGIKGTFDGALTAKDDQYHLSGAGRFEELDLSPALGLLTLGPPLGTSSKQAFWAVRPFRPGALRGLSFDVRTTADQLTLAPGTVVSTAAFNLEGGDGKLKLSNGSGELFGGSLNGSFAAENTVAGNLALTASVDLKQADLAAVLRDGGGKPLVHGKLSMEGSVKGQGRSPGGIVSVLEGSGEWVLGKSRLLGTNPGGFSQSIGGVDDAAKLEGLISASLHQGVWPFEAVRSKWSAQSGLLKLQPGEVTSEVAAGQVGGLVNLANGQLTADWTVRVAGVKDAPGYKVKLEGPAGKLVRSHDTTSLRSFLVVRVLQESMRKLEDLQREQERLFQERKKAKETPDQAPAAGSGEAEPVPAPDGTASQDTTAATETPAGDTAEEAAVKAAAEDKAKAEKEAEAKQQAEAEAKKRAEAEAAAKQKAEAEAKKEAERKAAEAAAKKEAERKAAEAAAKKEAERKAAEAAAKKEAERKAAEAAAKKEAERKAAEAAAREELARLAAEVAAREKAEAEAAAAAAAAEEAKRAEVRRLRAEEAREAARAVAEAEALRAAQEREGGDQRALGLQRQQQSLRNRAKDTNR